MRAWLCGRGHAGARYGTGINNQGCETCPGCIWAPTSGLAACTHYDEENVTAALDGADLAVVHIGFGGRPGENTDLKNLSLYVAGRRGGGAAQATQPRVQGRARK